MPEFATLSPPTVLTFLLQIVLANVRCHLTTLIRQERPRFYLRPGNKIRGRQPRPHTARCPGGALFRVLASARFGFRVPQLLNLHTSLLIAQLLALLLEDASGTNMYAPRQSKVHKCIGGQPSAAQVREPLTVGAPEPLLGYFSITDTALVAITDNIVLL
jgi:hypothetical protein